MNKKNDKTEKKTDLKKVEIKKTSSFLKKKKIKKNITSGIAYVYSTFNNTIISIADEGGNVVSWSSAGAKGFKGSRKSTPYAAQVAADDAARGRVINHAWPSHSGRAAAISQRLPSAGGRAAGGLRLSSMLRLPRFSPSL